MATGLYMQSPSSEGMDSTYRVPLLDSKLVRLRYAWYYHKSPSGRSSALATLRMPQPSFWTLNAVHQKVEVMSSIKLIVFTQPIIGRAP